MKGLRFYILGGSFCCLLCSCEVLVDTAFDSVFDSDSEIDPYNRAGERKSDSRIRAEREERFMYSVGN
jgi:hypothetical protein